MLENSIWQFLVISIRFSIRGQNFNSILISISQVRFDEEFVSTKNSIREEFDSRKLQLESDSF